MGIKDSYNRKQGISAMIIEHNRVHKGTDNTSNATIRIEDLRKFNKKLAPFKLYPDLKLVNTIDPHSVLFIVKGEYERLVPYVDRGYVDDLIKNHTVEERNVMFSEQILKKITNKEFLNSVKEYMLDVFLDLVDILEDRGISLDQAKMEYEKAYANERVRNNNYDGVFAYQNLRCGFDVFSKLPKSTAYILAAAYASYITNKELIDGLLPAKMNYKMKFGNFVSTYYTITNKFNKFENLKFIQDMLDIDDPVFMGCLSQLMYANSVKEDIKLNKNVGVSMNDIGPAGGNTEFDSVWSGEKNNLGPNTQEVKCMPSQMYSDKLLSETVLTLNKVKLNSGATVLSTFFRECGVDNVLSYFGETFTVNITRTQGERINNLSRKVDRCLILFENMGNMWNKMDAMDFAYDILNELDEEYIGSTDKNFLLALDSIRKDMTDGMIECRKKDIKKLRTTINIVYPKGYEG